MCNSKENCLSLLRILQS